MSSHSILKIAPEDPFLRRVMVRPSTGASVDCTLTVPEPRFSAVTSPLIGMPQRSDEALTKTCHEFALGTVYSEYQPGSTSTPAIVPAAGI